MKTIISLLAALALVPLASANESNSEVNMLGMTAASVAVFLAAAAAAAGVPKLWPAWANSAESPLSERIVVVDNARFICVAFVIFGHLLNYYNIDQSTHHPLVDQQALLSGADGMVKLVLQATNWRITMSCFVSGYAMRKARADANVNTIVLSIIAPLLLWTCFAKPVLLQTLMSPNRDTVHEVRKQLLSGHSFHHEWFLEALFAWQLFSFVLPPWRPAALMAVAGAISGIGGYWHFGNEGFISWDCVVGYVPFFVAGLLCPLKRLIAIVPQTRLNILLGLLTVVLVPSLMSMLLGPLPDSHGSYSQYLAANEFQSASDAFKKGLYAPFLLYWSRRLARQALELGQGLAFLLTLVPRDRTCFSDYGKHMIYSFVLHEVVLAHCNELVKLFPLPVITAPWLHAAVLFAQLCACSGIAAFLASWPVRVLFSPFLEPKWLGYFLNLEDGSDDFTLLPFSHKAQKSAKSPASDAFASPARFFFGDAKPSSEKVIATPRTPWSPHASLFRRGATTPAATPACSHGYSETIFDSLSKMKFADLCPWLLHTEVGKGRHTLPPQSAGHRFLKYLILFPLAQIACMIFTAVFVLPLTQEKFVGPVEHMIKNTLSSPTLLAIYGMGIIGAVIVDLGKDVVTFALLRRGLERVQLPANVPRLIHAIVICEYKEPFDVLEATIRSLMFQTLAHNTIIVIAQEDRDPEADETFGRLQALAGSSFRDFIRTRHTLAKGEVAGKSSNENFAVRQLYGQMLEQGIDPYTVMVTVADADSLFDTVFLEQLESEFYRLPDGRHTLFDSPINTYRNLKECNLIVQQFEIARSQFCTFTHLDWQPCQSNYSLTLGFAHTIGYWTPDNTSEDMHTTLKALAYTNAGLNAVVPVWSLILNDSVTGFHDRWVQAKRHMWGIEEVAWVVSLFPKLRWRVWSRLFALSAGQLLTVTVAPQWIFLLFPQTWALFAALGPMTRLQIVITTVLAFVYKWIKTFARERLMYTLILQHRKESMVPMSVLNWIVLVVTYPVLNFAAEVIFTFMATWRMLIHAVNHTSLKYVTAPKQFQISQS